MSDASIKALASRVLLRAGFCLIAAAASACVGQYASEKPAIPDEPTYQPLREVPVTIYFTGDCPTGIDPETVALDVPQNGNIKIAWTSEPRGKQFRVVWSPFTPDKKIANNGTVSSPPINRQTQSERNVPFKYTVIGLECDGPALDPRIIVN